MDRTSAQKRTDNCCPLYLEVVALTALTVPAAWHPLHHLLPLARLAGQAAHRGWDGRVSADPLHGVHLRGRQEEHRMTPTVRCIYASTVNVVGIEMRRRGDLRSGCLRLD